MKRILLTALFSLFIFGIMINLGFILADEGNDSLNDTDLNSENNSVSDNANDDSDDFNDTETPIEDEAENETDTEVEEDEEESEVEDIDVETEHEVEEMDIPPGVQLRILQLQRQLLIHILRANVVIDSLKEMGKNTSELESIVAELEILKEESKIIPDNREEAVQKFVDIKKEARDLIKEFREAVRELTTESERSEIKVKFSGIREDEELISLNEQIREAIKELHKKRVENVLDSLNVEHEELLAKIQSGEIPVEELREKLREHYSTLPEETKIRVRDNLMKARIEMRTDRIRVITESVDGRRERLEVRFDERADKLERSGHPIASERLRRVSERVDSRRTSGGNSGSDDSDDDNSGDSG